jgi:hypothetical protein
MKAYFEDESTYRVVEGYARMWHKMGKAQYDLASEIGRIFLDIKEMTSADSESIPLDPHILMNKKGHKILCKKLREFLEQ